MIIRIDDYWLTIRVQCQYWLMWYDIVVLLLTLTDDEGIQRWPIHSIYFDYSHWLTDDIIHYYLFEMKYWRKSIQLFSIVYSYYWPFSESNCLLKLTCPGIRYSMTSDWYVFKLHWYSPDYSSDIIYSVFIIQLLKVTSIWYCPIERKFYWFWLKEVFGYWWYSVERRILSIIQCIVKWHYSIQWKL